MICGVNYIFGEAAAKQLHAIMYGGNDRVSFDKLFSYLLHSSRSRAKKRALPHTIDAAFLWQRMVAQNNCCAVSRVPFDLARTKGQKLFERPFAPSLDRIDNLQGYTATNVRLVCRLLNFAANRWGLEAVLRVAEGVVAGNTSGQSLQTMENLANQGVAKL